MQINCFWSTHWAKRVVHWSEHIAREHCPLTHLNNHLVKWRGVDWLAGKRSALITARSFSDVDVSVTASRTGTRANAGSVQIVLAELSNYSRRFSMYV